MKNAPNSPSNASKHYSSLHTLDNASTQALAHLCGQFDAHLKQIEERLKVRIVHRGNEFSLQGDKKAVQAASSILYSLYEDIQNGLDMTPDHVHLAIQQFHHDNQNDGGHSPSEHNLSPESLTVVQTKKGKVKPRGKNQQVYVRAVLTNDINFGIGPAGTGKTYLAVACAVQALLSDEIERILLVRPAVEAGEKLGFLPGDLSQKVDPYLRPLYDALYEMLGFETVDKLIEKNVIEVAPLAYMRGRTLNNAFVILDESQNTTREQMKMFLTRIGFGTTAVINGDPSQIDLPRGQPSGLKHAVEVLDGVDGISFTHFTSKDVVRHPIVQRIVDAYDRAEQ
ncbi:MAG: PhoH family protein [Cellvibrionaceae bacterium]